MQLSNFTNQAQFRVLNCIIPTAGTYNSIASRELQVHASLENLNALTVRTNNYSNLSQEAIMNAGLDVGTHIMGLNAQSQGSVVIDGGWDSQRQLILLTLENPNTHTLFVVSGFTSPDFLDWNNQINPHAVVKFDAVLTMIPTLDMYGQVIGYDIGESDSILSPTYVNGAIVGAGGADLLTSAQRPTDLLQSASLQMVFQDMVSGPITTSMDGDTGRTTKFSNQRNGLGNDYLYRTLTAYTDSQANNKDMEASRNSGYSTSTNVMDGAMQSACIAESNYQQSQLVNSILQSASESRAATVEWTNLEAALPELGQHQGGVVTIIPGDSGVMSAGTDVLDWHGKYEAVYISELAVAIQSLIKGYGLSFVGFEMSIDTNSNYSMDTLNRPTFNWLYDSGAGSDMFRLFNPLLPEGKIQHHFQAYMCSVVLPRIAGDKPVRVRVEASAVKDMTIIMEYSDNPVVRAVAPTFAFGLWTPVNTANRYGVDQLATDMNQLFTYIDSSRDGSVTMPHAQAYTQEPTNQMTYPTQPSNQPTYTQQPSNQPTYTHQPAVTMPDTATQYDY